MVELTVTRLNSSSSIAASTADLCAYSCSSCTRSTVDLLRRHDVLPCGIALLYLYSASVFNEDQRINPFILITYGTLLTESCRVHLVRYLKCFSRSFGSSRKGRGHSHTVKESNAEQRLLGLEGLIRLLDLLAHLKAKSAATPQS